MFSWDLTQGQDTVRAVSSHAITNVDLQRLSCLAGGGVGCVSDVCRVVSDVCRVVSDVCRMLSDWDGVCLVSCEVCLVRHGVCHFCPYLSCLAASRMGLVIAETETEGRRGGDEILQ